MPIMQTHLAKKFKCASCGWSIVRPKFIHGDALSGLEFVDMQDVCECSKCKSTDIKKVGLGIVDLLNPFIKRDWGRWKERIGILERS